MLQRCARRSLFARLATKLAAAQSDALLLTITLEPDRDPPVVMANAARRFGADWHHWRWVSGTSGNVRALLDGYRIARLDDAYHGTFAYVLGRDARVARIVSLSTDGDRVLFELLQTSARCERARCG